MPTPAAATSPATPEWTNSKAATVGTWVADPSKGAKPASGPGTFRQVAEASTKGTVRVLVFTDGTSRSFGVATKLFVAQAKPNQVTPDPKPSRRAQAAAALAAEPEPQAEEPQAATSRPERLRLAKLEHATLQAWTKDGENPPRPATPNLDAINAENTPTGRKVQRTATTDRAPSGHRAPGAFQLQVREYLQANTTAEGLTPCAIDKALAHGNSGQVGNALEALVKKGIAVKVSAKPRRYSAVA